MAQKRGGRSTFFSIYLFYILMVVIVLPIVGIIFYAVQSLGLPPLAGGLVLLMIPVGVTIAIFYRRKLRWEALQAEVAEGRRKAEIRDSERESKGLSTASNDDVEEDEWLRAARARARNGRCPQCSKKTKHDTGLYCDFKDRRNPRCLIGPFCSDRCLSDHTAQHPKVEFVPER